MKIKVFTPNEKGKIEFTPAELEKLLNDTYAEGQQNCNCGSHITWTNPYVAPYINCSESTTTNASTSGAPATATITLDNKDREAARKYISDTVAALRRAQAAPGDVFTNLAKELNF